MKSIYDFDAIQMNGQPLALASLRGQVMLIVNTASACGFTPQFGGLEKIHQAYKDQAWPCWDFLAISLAAKIPAATSRLPASAN